MDVVYRHTCRQNTYTYLKKGGGVQKVNRGSKQQCSEMNYIGTQVAFIQEHVVVRHAFLVDFLNCRGTQANNIALCL